MHINVQRVVTQTVLKSLLGGAVRWLLVCVAMGVAAVMPLSAQPQDKAFRLRSEDRVESIASIIQGSRWALLVGIAKYPSVEGFEIKQLEAPVKDVKALAAFLKDPQKGGFEADHVFTLTDEEATREEILGTFEDIAGRAGPNDMVIFYFSGHGTRHIKRETTYLIPYDHDLRRLGTTCIDFDDLAADIQDMEANKVVVILDACHAGGVKPTGARETASTGLAERLLEMFQESEGRALLLSSDESEVSWETEEYGIFTHFLLEGLDGKADENDDGIVTFTEAAQYVEDEVPKYTHDKFPGVQRPARRHLSGIERGEIPLAINWPAHDAFRQEQQDLLDNRTAAIIRAGLAGLDRDLKELSHKVAGSVYRKTLIHEKLTEQEESLLPEIDALKDETITVDQYITRARAIHKMYEEPVQPEEELQNDYIMRTTVLRTSLADLDGDLEEFSLQVADKALSGEPLTEQEALLLQEIDALKDGTITATEYVKRAQVIRAPLVQLQIVVTPDDATVTLASADAPDQSISPSSRNAYQIRQGRYHLSVELPGYAPYADELTLDQESKEVTVALERSLGTLELQVEPADAVVRATPLSVAAPYTGIDASEVAISLQKEHTGKLPVGTYRVTAERDGYEPTAEEPVEIRVNDSTRVTLVLTSKPATIIAPGLPDGTRVFVDGVSVVPPCKLPVGKHRIGLERDGFKPVEESVVLEPGQALTLPPEWFPLEPRISRPKAFAVSLAVPGLGQHIQERHRRGLLYEAGIFGTGVVALWAAAKDEDTVAAAAGICLCALWGANALDAGIADGKAFAASLAVPGLGQHRQGRHWRGLLYEAGTIGIFTTAVWANAKDKGDGLQTAAWITLGVLWGANALDAGFFAEPARYSSETAFEAHPTSDDVKVLVRAPF
jgi:uncharacterized caspase-like protein